MKKATIILFLKIWGLHMFLYYLIFGTLITFPNLKWQLDTLQVFFVFPIVGIAGMLDHCVAFPLIPILGTLLLIKFTKLSMFDSYVIAIFTCYILKMITQYFLITDERIIYEWLIGRRLAMLACIVSLSVTSYLIHLILDLRSEVASR